MKIISSENSGQALVLAVIVVGLVLVNTLMVIGGSQLFFQNTTYITQSTQAVNLAEAGVDKALSSLNDTGGAYFEEKETMIGPGSFAVTITSPDPSTKIIEATGYIPSKANPKVKRTVKTTASKGVGVSFNYGVQVGEGGISMSETSRINGSVYSNGSINLSNGAIISGDVYVAGGTEAAADQSSECTLGGNCTDFIFGKNVGGNDRLAVAQSFKPSAQNYLNKISLRLKKTGFPPDIPVRILKDKNGQPDKTKVIASGTLTANLVTDQYGFVEVAFNSPPLLYPDERYWVVLSTTLNPSNYWYWSADSLQGYFNGLGLWSSDWQSGNWTDPNLDFDFMAYMGGEATFIQGGNGSNIGGDAHANTLQNLIITGGAYYQTASNVVAGSMHPGSPDPASKVMPISDSNISDWKNIAASAGTYTGDITSCRPTLGPGKYVGNINIDSNGCTQPIIIQDPVWVTGTLTLKNNVTLRLDPSYGASSGVILVDGVADFDNNIKIQGSGTTGSILMVVSTYDSRVNGISAIKVENGGNSGILYAPFGVVKVENNNRLSELTAWRIELANGVVIDYDTGLASSFFSSGSPGSFSLIKGTYQLK